MLLNDFWSLLGIIYGLTMLVYVRHAQSSGRIMGKIGFIYRAKQPALFRAYKVIYSLIGVSSVFFILGNRLGLLN